MSDNYEDHFLAEDRKFSRKERKRITQKDRSKYKKTDQDKLVSEEDLHKKVQQKDFIRGRILSIISQDIIVDVDGIDYRCVLKGSLKKEQRHRKNIVTVGDFILMKESSRREGVIFHIEPRTSYLSRADNITRRKEQFIAANVDQVIITVSVVDPVLRPAIVDRYLISVWKGKMKPLIVINKSDLLSRAEPEELEIYREFIEAYSLEGVRVIPLSTITGEGLEELRGAMCDKVSVFAGQSGVGKTSLINYITGLDLTVGDTVAITRKGAHTTSRSQLIKLESGGWCVDTPGIKSFGIWDLNKRELSRYFPDIWEYGNSCQFQDCMHLSEPGCAVTKALEEGSLSKIRYNSYKSLLEELDEKYLRR